MGTSGSGESAARGLFASIGRKGLGKSCILERNKQTGKCFKQSSNILFPPSDM